MTQEQTPARPMQAGLFPVASLDSCARACLKAARAGREVIYFPAVWRPIMALIRALPERLFKHLDM